MPSVHSTYLAKLLRCYHHGNRAAVCSHAKSVHVDSRAASSDPTYSPSAISITEDMRGLHRKSLLKGRAVRFQRDETSTYHFTCNND